MLSRTQNISNLRSWIFRIAHNKAVDYTRSYARRFGESLDEHFDIAGDTRSVEDQDLTKMGLQLFMRLTPQQRGAVILKDVLDHSLSEIAEILELSVASVKGALHRGRISLRKATENAGESARPLDPSETSLLETYVKHFVDQDFDALRKLLAQDVRLDVIGVTQSSGASAVGQYFNKYGGVEDWKPRLGSIEGRPAVLVFDTREPAARPIYFILIDWVGGEVARIRDYRYSRYVMTSAEFRVLDAPSS